MELWVARDSSGSLSLHGEKPVKLTDRWASSRTQSTFLQEWLPEITWEDEEPTMFKSNSIMNKSKEMIKSPREPASSLLDESERLRKPVLPQFVADWLVEKDREGRNIRGMLDGLNATTETDEWKEFRDKVNEENNRVGWTEIYELLARAWLVGFKVEKEKKYRVKDSKGNYLLWKRHDGVVTLPRAVVTDRTVSGECLELTEQEIKDIDEKYWIFREEVSNDMEDE